MVGPDNSRHWARVDFLKIDAKESFEAKDSFCDEQGNINPEFPTMHWKNEFLVTENGTKVIVQITFPNELAIQKILEMGFELGFSMALDQLDQYLSSGFKNSQRIKER
jgi:PhnB protein